MKVKLVPCVVCLLLFASMVVLPAITMAQLPDEDVLTLESPIIGAHRRPIVKFGHTTHLDDFGIACNECHHTYKNGENVWQDGDPVKKCQECHNDATTQNEIQLPNKKLNLKWAFHQNCKGCHLKLYKESKVEGAPVRCQTCHVE